MSGVGQREVRPQEAGWRFDRWAKEHFPELPFGQLQKLLRTGQFRVDGKRVQASARLLAGQIVRVPPLNAPTGDSAPQRARPALDPRDAAFIQSLVIHRDETLIALDKPAGLAVQGGSGTSRHVDGLLDALADGGERPRLVHRLDRDTSGLLVVARTAAAARELSFAFQQHRVRKLYWALVLRGPERNEGVIDLRLGKAGSVGREKMRVPGDEEADDGKPAKTAFKVLARAGKAAAWVALVPLTGRTHQLRAHCAAIGAPILGDGKYGGKAAHMEGLPKGLMLHARELELPRERGRPLHLVAEPPKPFKAALAWLGMESPELPGAGLKDWAEAQTPMRR